MVSQKLAATPSFGSLLHFDIEVDSSDDRLSEWKRGQLADQVSMLRNQVSASLRPESILQTRLLRDIRTLKREDPVVLAAKLSSYGYHKVTVRSAQGGASGSAECFYNLRNEFLIVETDDGQHYIFDPAFKGHFAIPQPTERYAGLLEAIPETVALSPAMLSQLVNLICTEMALAFQERGLSLPPWRQGKSLLSKWLPTKARDLDMSSPTLGGSPRALYAAGSSPQYSGELPIGDDSPRAVLHGAAAFLSIDGNKPPLAVRPVKQRSLLTSDLIASGNVSPKASEEKEVAPSGWATPPIRRVKMSGVPASARAN